MGLVVSAYRDLPSVDRLIAALHSAFPDSLPDARLVTNCARAALDTARAAIRGGATAPSLDELVTDTANRLQRWLTPFYRPVINATGVILHTNLGRAPLSAAATAAAEAVARGYSSLEYDLDSGQRGSRLAGVERLLTQLTGAEAALAVNNNAAAVYLALAAVAVGREVVVSRGQAVEIGGGFRIPDVLAQSGARLVEVGTTNRTYAADYARVLGADTGAVLRVHPSNFLIVGFTHEPALAELVAVAHEAGVPVIDDLGSGCLLDPRPFGLPLEPLVGASVAAGADLVCFSGDKLLGGPQAGLIVGQRALVERLRRHPLARALRLDKLSLAALEATLGHYLRGEALAQIPIWRMIAVSPESLARRAQAWADALGPAATLAPSQAAIGGGSLPGQTLPGPALALAPAGASADALAAALRRQTPPVIGRIADDRLLLDPRTVLDDQDEALVAGVRAALSGENSGFRIQDSG